ncbi:MAG: hypothetical protein FWD61_08485 [Phycisphaerales bacterium]|nr:hypothetical protein [Phycisphaerales bacterium]
MQFFLHGGIHPDTQTALLKNKHVCHTLLEFAEDSAASEEMVNDPMRFVPLLAKKQWNLITTDADFVRQLYEHKIAFDGIIVQIVESPADDPRMQITAIPRLFERYPRLTPRRLYMVTRSRVKIRQLPGAAQAD